MCCGAGHNLAVSTSGALYSWGRNFQVRLALCGVRMVGSQHFSCVFACPCLPRDNVGKATHKMCRSRLSSRCWLQLV